MTETTPCTWAEADADDADRHTVRDDVPRRSCCDTVRAENERLRAGEDESQPEPHSEMNPGQLWNHLLSLPTHDRIETLAQFLRKDREASRCIVMNHDGAVQHLREALRNAEAKVARVEALADDYDKYPNWREWRVPSAIRAALADPAPVAPARHDDTQDGAR